MRFGLVLIAKLPSAIKLTMVGIAVLSGAIATGIGNFHDPWFDLVLLMFIGAIVGGEPEPDLQLPFRSFCYLWFYRSSHLFISAATAYFLHKNKWPDISGKKESSET